MRLYLVAAMHQIVVDIPLNLANRHVVRRRYLHRFSISVKYAPLASYRSNCLDDPSSGLCVTATDAGEIEGLHIYIFY